MEFWPSLAAVVCLLLGFIILVWHSAIDLKLRILPDELTIALCVLGLLFHWSTHPFTGTWLDPLMGAIIGGGALALVRQVANYLYGFETMGLGDVKLLAAFGIWLGAEGVLFALIAGALAGVLHGISLLFYARLKSRDHPSFREMTVPAGPGFCIGAAIIAIWQFSGSLPLFAGAS